MASTDRWPGFCKAYAKEFNISYQAAVAEAREAWDAYKTMYDIQLKSKKKGKKQNALDSTYKQNEGSHTKDNPPPHAPSPYDADKKRNEKKKAQNRKTHPKRMRDSDDDDDDEDSIEEEEGGGERTRISPEEKARRVSRIPLTEEEKNKPRKRRRKNDGPVSPPRAEPMANSDYYYNSRLHPRDFNSFSPPSQSLHHSYYNHHPPPPYPPYHGKM